MLKTQGFVLFVVLFFGIFVLFYGLDLLWIKIMAGTMQLRLERAHKVLFSRFYFKDPGSSRRMELPPIEFRSFEFMFEQLINDYD